MRCENTERGSTVARAGPWLLLAMVLLLAASLFAPLVWSANAASNATSSSTTQTATSAAAAPKISLSNPSDGPGVTIGITGSGLAANRTVSATFGNLTLSLTGTCTTNSAGKLSGCSFSVPNLPHGTYTVSVSDGTSPVVTASFTIPVLSIPDSTLLVTSTSLCLSLVTQLVTRRVVNLDAERRMKAEVSAFNKEKREATIAKDKAKLDKLKKRELPMRQEQAKVSTARLKVTAITFVPLLAVYYLMASFLGGFSVVVAHSPIPIPYLVGTGGTMALFWWYMLSSFTSSALLTRLLHTTT